MSQEEIILSVSEISNAVKFCLEKTFPTLSVRGEISNFKKQSSGHLYFSLKDESAQIACVMFRGDAASLEKPFKDGDSVIIKGAMNVYPAGGRYQIVVKELKLAGLGELLLRLEELKAKIHKKGWFDKSRKKALPKNPKRIGVVTSPTGAVIQDICNVLKRRYPGIHVLLNPVKVQGAGAAEEIAAAIKQFNTHDLADVLIVGRGGGSMEDLFAFNEEIVAEAIFFSAIPVVCAVGHETDHCIAEYVADLRAPTPSAAAEMVVPEKSALSATVGKMQRALASALKKTVATLKAHLMQIAKSQVFKDPYRLIGTKAQALDDEKEALDFKMRSLLETLKLRCAHLAKRLDSEKPTAKLLLRKQKLKHLDERLNQTIRIKTLSLKSWIQKSKELLQASAVGQVRRLKDRMRSAQCRKNLDDAIKRLIIFKIQKLHHLQELMQAQDPKNLLGRGYSILFSEKGDSVIKSLDQLEKEQNFTVMLSDGKAAARLTHRLNEK